MSQVEFETDQYRPGNIYNNRPSGLVSLLIKYGLAEDEEQANKMLLIFFSISIILIFLIFLFSGSSGPKVKLSPEKIIQIQQMGEEI